MESPFEISATEKSKSKGTSPSLCIEPHCRRLQRNKQRKRQYCLII
jgi:hypothetical protein